MFKFMLIFYQPQQSQPPQALDAFENSYQDLLALVERMPHILRRQVIHIVGSPTGTSPYYRILEVYYDDQATMQRSLLSPQGQEAGKQIQTFPTGAFEMAFAEVYEEAGGATSTQQPTSTNSTGAATT